MNRYHICYDLNSPGQNYEALRKELEELDAWCHYLKSTYLVKTNLNMDDLINLLSQHLDKSDRLLVTKIVGPVSGWLSDDQWEWLNENMDQD